MELKRFNKLSQSLETRKSISSSLHSAPTLKREKSTKRCESCSKISSRMTEESKRRSNSSHRLFNLVNATYQVNKKQSTGNKLKKLSAKLIAITRSSKEHKQIYRLWFYIKLWSRLVVASENTSAPWSTRFPKWSYSTAMSPLILRRRSKESGWSNQQKLTWCHQSRNNKSKNLRNFTR